MKTEKALSIIFLIGIVLKFFHIPGGGVLSIISLLPLAICYLFFGFYFFCGKNIKQQNLILSIISGIFFSLVPLGIVFKIQWWHGGYMFLVIAMCSTPIVFFISYYLKNKEKGDLEKYYNDMVNRSLILTIVSVLFYLAPIQWN
jgi:hypothetical protein